MSTNFISYNNSKFSFFRVIKCTPVGDTMYSSVIIGLEINQDVELGIWYGKLSKDKSTQETPTPSKSRFLINSLKVELISFISISPSVIVI